MRPNQRSLFIFFKYRCYRVCMIKKLIWIIAFYRTSHTNFYPDSAPFQTAIKDRTTEHQITRSFCMTSIKERKIDQTSTSYHLLHKPVLALSTFFNPMPRKTVSRKTEQPVQTSVLEPIVCPVPWGLSKRNSKELLQEPM